MSWREFRIGEGIRRAEMLVRPLKCVSGACDTEGNGEASIHFDMLIGATCSHVSLLPEVKEITSFGQIETSSTSS